MSAHTVSAQGLQVCLPVFVATAKIFWGSNHITEMTDLKSSNFAHR